MNMMSVVTSISMLGFVVVLGMLIGARITITQDAKKLLMIIIINIAIPAVILNGIFNTKIDDGLLGMMLTIFLLSIALNIFCLALSWGGAHLFGFRSIKAKKFAVLAGIGNSGFIGIPLCSELFGPTGGLLAGIFDAGLDVVVFSIVVIMLQEGNGFSLKRMKTLINLPFLAVVTGFVIALIGFEPPVIAKNLAAFLASLAAPLAMIYIGLLIPEFFRKKINIPVKFVSLSLVMKLLLIPLLTIALLSFFPLPEMVRKVTYVLLAMPTITLAPVLLARYTNDETTGLMATIYSTVFSLLTIPFILYVVNALFGF
ncbi:AEC family transporter [Alkalihalobacillus oceani]|uniref:AEC family transporter n=1 Tax=Halalkalibacter oceani TaxID=1653776 RepID=A0A9X2DP77_9BACI|nr:AEC family transporter [Halalkalibacter oceani]MCM3714566.1 AEC family transporter [Halalkalibacter oceani]